MVCEDMDLTLTSEEAEKILGYLDDWILKTENNESSTNNDDITSLTTDSSLLDDEDREDLINHNKELTLQEIQLVFIATFYEVQNYLKREMTPDRNSQYWNGILKWCAGRLWKKYDIRPSEDMTDGTPNWGYGDHLIYDAKKELAPYIKSTIKIF